LCTRALNQALRELLLAQSSDWAFIMTTGTTVEYATNRTKLHVSRFHKIYNWLTQNNHTKNNAKDNINEKELEHFEWTDAIFPDIDFRVYTTI